MHLQQLKATMPFHKGKQISTFSNLKKNFYFRLLNCLQIYIHKTTFQ